MEKLDLVQRVSKKGVVSIDLLAREIHRAYLRMPVSAYHAITGNTSMHAAVEL